MEKQLNLVSYEQAQRLKKAGFDWETKLSVIFLKKKNNGKK